MERPENCMNLFDYNNGQIDEGLAKEFMRQLVEAAIQIHKAAVFHHDLKPENILIQFYDAWHIPRVRVIDFGCGWFEPIALGLQSLNTGESMKLARPPSGNLAASSSNYSVKILTCL
ncbi:hypothetical protein D4764_19G0002100 [Takifugu flavidus]|uniref:Serine/threonine-protein kinase 1 n=1 Tax=Takifugu flavidus TaxID=433684 RepID=A0A5C6NLF9_9TELE|nr:hypothetical protein D4764_19G0002100 [Takifugu flavidus]